MPTVTESGSSYIRINKVTSGFTWNVQIAAADETGDAIQDAKTRALAISRELENDLTNDQTADAETSF